jgi:hypothetical protein
VGGWGEGGGLGLKLNHSSVGERGENLIDIPGRGREKQPCRAKLRLLSQKFKKEDRKKEKGERNGKDRYKIKGKESMRQRRGEKRKRITD